MSSKCGYHSAQTCESASCMHSKNNNEYKFLFNEYLSSAGHVVRALHFAFPFHSHNSIIISALHTRKLWLERFSNLSKVTQLNVTNRVQTKDGLSQKPVLFTAM